MENRRLQPKKIADYKAFNFVDGEGVRNSLYVSGCLFACEGCFNKAVQNFNYGTPFTESLMNQIIEDLSHDYVQGLTLWVVNLFLNTDVCLSVVKRSGKHLAQPKISGLGLGIPLKNYF